MSIRHITSALLVCLSSAPLCAQAKVPGWAYTMNITFDSGTGPANRGSMAIRYLTTANAMRMELLQIGGTANRVTGGESVEGVYTILNDADSTSTTVLPGQHAAMVMPSPRAMFENQPMPSVDTKTVTQSMEDLGNGGVILGHQTRHFRTKTTGSMTFTTGDGACTRSADGESEMWIAPDLDITPAMQSMVAHYGFAAAESSSAQSSLSPMKGLPVRTKTRTTAVLPNGESRVIETTMEFTELSNAPLDASLFKIPDDYKVMDMRAQMAGMFSKAEDVAKARGQATAGLCPK